MNGTTGLAQTPTLPATGDATFAVFLNGTHVGREQVRLARSGSTWIITSTGKYGPPIDIAIDRFELKYTADWQPVNLHIEAIQGGRPISLLTSFGVTTAINEVTQKGVTNSKTDQISARTIVLTNNFYAGYEAFAARLAPLEAGAELKAYVAPQAEVTVTVKKVSTEALQTPSGPQALRRFELALQNPGGPVEVRVTVDARSRFARLEIPTASLLVVREDLAGVASRPQPQRNPTDADVTVPAHGFNIAGTLTIPPVTGRMRHPTVVLVNGSGPIDRDESVAGIPIYAQLAGALAQQGYAVLRYDKRASGQSGGRSETVTLADYADDLTAVVKWLAKRKDVDPRHIAVAGHGEGGWVALLAAREKKIASLVLLATPGTTGAELILEQQQHLLDVAKTPEADRQAKIELQKKIHNAVITEKGWDSLPPAVRKQADSPWFRSLLLFDPARALKNIRQPLLIVQGSLDTQVPPHHAERIAQLGRARKKGGPVEVAQLTGLNHLLVKATSGEASEYPSLEEKTISPEVAKVIADWLRKIE
jgi:pimeloyl-ACP methyl ester carboxylesterase